MLATLRAMPGGVRLFLLYAFMLLVGTGLSLRFVVDLAISAPISAVGLVVMALLAYTIFTITLVLQRKAAGWGLALGLSSLTVPAVPFLYLGAGVAGGLFALVLAILLFRGLLASSARAWLSEP